MQVAFMVTKAMLYLLAEGQPPTRLIDVIKLPVGLSILALIIWAIGAFIQTKSEVKLIKHLAWLPLIFAFFTGARQLKDFLTDPVYKAFVSTEGGKTTMGHYMGAIVPMLAAGIFLYWNYRLTQAERDTLDRF
jgi:hypothetical protein